MVATDPSLLPSILVVEDEILIRLELVDMIEEAGFTVYEAGNAEEALLQFKAHRDIRVLITDIDMPGSMDGLMLSHHVRKCWPPVRVIVASSHVKVTTQQLPDQGLFIDKPYDTPRVRSILSKIATEIHAA